MKAILFIFLGALTSLWAANPLDTNLDQVQWYDMVVSVSRCDRFSGIPNDIFCHLEGLPPGITKNAYVDAAQAKATELIDAELLATFPREDYRTDALSAILMSQTIDPTSIQEAKGRIEQLCTFAAQKEEDFSIRYETIRMSYTTPESLDKQKLTNMLFDIALESINCAYVSKKAAFLSLNILATTRATE